MSSACGAHGDAATIVSRPNAGGPKGGDMQEIDPQRNGMGGWVAEAIRFAISERRHAWAPITKVRVGATIVTKHGDGYVYVAGCNVEWSTSIELHATKVAVARMVAERGFDPKQAIMGVAIAYVGTRDDQHALQCGCCRQVLMDFGGPGVMVYGVKLAADNAVEPSLIERAMLQELLPYPFTHKHFQHISNTST